MATLTAYSATHAPVRAARRAASLEDVLLGCYLLLLAWVPFWFGSNSAFAWGVNAVILSSLVIAYELGLLLRGTAHPVAPRMILVPLLAFAACLVAIGMQLAPWTPAVLHHPLWGVASETLGRPLAGSITISPDLTALALMRLLTAASAFWLALQLGRDARRARRLLVGLAAIGVAYAAYGAVSFYVLPGKILWFDKAAYGEVLTATFTNRNSFATYAGCTAVVCLAIFLGTMQSAASSGSWSLRTARVAAAFVGPAGLALAAGAVVAFALMLTGSRGGITATFLALAGTILLFAARERGASAPSVALAAVAFGLLCILLVAAGEVYVGRLERAGSHVADRLAVYDLTKTSILASPWTGSGYGTFERAFPMFRDGSVSLRNTWDKAHNTHLEILQGLGVVAGTLLFVAAGAIALRCFRGVLTRRQGIAAPLAAFGATVLVALHALVDFSLQIQAVTITWAALIGLGLAQSWSTLTDTSSAQAGAGIPPQAGRVRLGERHRSNGR